MVSEMELCFYLLLWVYVGKKEKEDEEAFVSEE